MALSYQHFVFHYKLYGPHQNNFRGKKFRLLTFDLKGYCCLSSSPMPVTASRCMVREPPPLNTPICLSVPLRCSFGLSARDIMLYFRRNNFLNGFVYFPYMQWELQHSEFPVSSIITSLSLKLLAYRSFDDISIWYLVISFEKSGMKIPGSWPFAQISTKIFCVYIVNYSFTFYIQWRKIKKIRSRAIGEINYDTYPHLGKFWQSLGFFRF